MITTPKAMAVLRIYGIYAGGLRAAWKASPVQTLIVAVVAVAVLAGATAAMVMPPAIEGQQPFAIVALVLLLPVIVAQWDNLHRWGMGRPAAWPRWFTLTAFLNLMLGVAVLVSESTGVRKSLDLPKWLFDEPIAASSLIALLLAIFLLAPRAFAWLALGLKRLPLPAAVAGCLPTAAGLYGVVCVACAIAAVSLLVVVVVEGEGASTFVLTLAWAGFCVQALVLRNTLWQESGYAVWARILPHVPVFLIFAGLLEGPLLKDLELYNAEIGFLSIMGASTLLGIGGALYWSAQRLRSSPVVSLAAAQDRRAESIQSRVEHYVDVHGLSSRFVRDIERSDGGVYGITGVRGAGKSALTRHVLSQLEPRFFVAEVTAPVRHDADMGFLLAVCRKVCSKVIEDLEPILKGARPGAQAQIALRFRNLFAVVALAGVVLTGLVQLLSAPLSAPLSITKHGGPLEVPGLFVVVSDPLLGSVEAYRTYPLLAERRAIDHLLTLIDQALLAETDTQRRLNQAARYLLVPNPGSRGFLLLPHSGQEPAAAHLRRYRASLGDIDLHPAVFFSGLLAGLLPEDTERVTRKEVWDGLSRAIADAPAIRAPLGHSLSVLRPFLLTQEAEAVPLPVPSLRPDAAAGDEPADAEPQIRAPLLSHLILAAFERSDSGLSFNYARLEQFGEFVRVYRQLLDGRTVVRPPASARSVLTSGSLDLSPRAWLDVSQANIVILWTLVAILMLLWLAGPSWRALSTLARAVVNRRYLDAYAEALSFNEQLSYQTSREASAGFAWQGLSFGRKRTLAARDLTLPGITARYLRFLEKVQPLYNGKLVIAIDELDKVHDPEQVKELLTEIKGALFTKGTFYLISISEDAARSFRRRLASGRDIFESTFDDVVDIRQMAVDSAVKMLARRDETGDTRCPLPEHCLQIAALFGGGIPREIIRARRTLSHAAGERRQASPAWAVWVLLLDELDQWQSNMGEANLTGSATVKLRGQARMAIDALGRAPADAAAYDAVWDALAACVPVIDPNGLRHSVGYIAEESGGTENTDGTQYRQIASDLQLVLRLMVLTHLSQLVLRPGARMEDYAERILACHRALADKPALAEALLDELRRASTGAAEDGPGVAPHPPPAAV